VSAANAFKPAPSSRHRQSIVSSPTVLAALRRTFRFNPPSPGYRRRQGVRVQVRVGQPHGCGGRIPRSGARPCGGRPHGTALGPSPARPSEVSPEDDTRQTPPAPGKAKPVSLHKVSLHKLCCGESTTHRAHGAPPSLRVPISRAGCQGPSAWQAAIVRRRSLAPPSGNRAADSTFRGTLQAKDCSACASAASKT